MTTNTEYKEMIHQMVDHIESNKGLKMIFTVAHRVFIHEGAGKHECKD